MSLQTNVIEIDNFMASELDVYARLNEAQLLHLYEPKAGIFIAESQKVIQRALDAGYTPISFLMEKKMIEKEGRELVQQWKEVPVYTAELSVLTQITGYQLTRGMLCALYRKQLEPVEEICSSAKRIAILEEVVNPTNVGAIFRSAAALHMDAVLLTKGCSNPLYRRASRVSMGTVFQVPWTIIDHEWPGAGMRLLQQYGFKTVALALKEDSIPIDDARLQQEEKLAVILGTEGEGLKSDTIAGCDYNVIIPMSHGVDSLNVAAASAVAFWQLGNR